MQQQDCARRHLAPQSAGRRIACAKAHSLRNCLHDRHWSHRLNTHSALSKHFALSALFSVLLILLSSGQPGLQNTKPLTSGSDTVWHQLRCFCPCPCSHNHALHGRAAPAGQFLQGRGIARPGLLPSGPDSSCDGRKFYVRVKQVPSP